MPDEGAVASATAASGLARGILKGMEPRRWGEGPGYQVVRRGLSIASEGNEACRPVHLLAALEEVQGPFSSVLRPGNRRWLYPRAEPPSNLGGSMGYLGSQAVRAATTFADSRQELFTPPHLLLAVLDQADAEVLQRLNGAGIDPARARAVAAKTLGAPPDLAPVAMPELCPVGTHDRPPLPIDELDPPAWAALSWRQRHLPLRRLKRQRDWYALSNLERRAAWRVADRRGLDDDQRYSLLCHHHDRVQALSHEVRPDLVETRQQLKQGSQHSMPRLAHQQRPRAWRRVALLFMAGWPTWFSNRRAGLRDKSFRLVTASAYRGQPDLPPPR
jgi:hypothetical protein